MGFTALRMNSLFESMSNQLESLSSDTDPEETKLVLENLKETHATSAGLKAFCTWGALECIEKCRASLGGHGYSAYSGLPSMAADQAVQCTWEGDNVSIVSFSASRCHKLISIPMITDYSHPSSWSITHLFLRRCSQGY